MAALKGVYGNDERVWASMEYRPIMIINNIHGWNIGYALKRDRSEEHLWYRDNRYRVGLYYPRRKKGEGRSRLKFGT